MSQFDTPVLRSLLRAQPDWLPGGPPDSAAALIDAYDSLYPQLESCLWAADDAAFDDALAHYQALFREQQALIDATGARAQHRFVIGIPVADRPAHLRQCLESILQLCRLYGYGGRDADGRYAGVEVIVAEDSRDARHVAAHRALVEAYREQGLQVAHFDLPEQYALLQAIPEPARRQVARLLTDQPAGRFYQKGQAANRNLCILKMRQRAPDARRALYYLVDSDQAFLVNRQTAAGETAVPALNYFYCIDRIFRTADVRVLSGKLVGDPPVSPAVMAANFLDDALAFLDRIAACDPQSPCGFHGQTAPLPGDAAYHDLAQLFGFAAQTPAFDYRCPLPQPHDHAACLAGFAGRLRGFFFGAHPTRRTGFRHAGDFAALTPARTIYPGNTVVDEAGLRYIIPFGHLRLRMSGPTAGRLIQAEIGARFATANLPMLHRRIAADDTRDEFRPGVTEGPDAAVDISNEFERQFFGDLMLFSVTDWLKTRTLDALADAAAVAATVARVEGELLGLYAGKRDAVNARLSDLDRWLGAAPAGLCDGPTLDRIRQFRRDLAANFGADAAAWRQIGDPAHRAARRAQIVDALTRYRDERAAWDRLVTP
jgi:hypothetical protein